MEDAKCQCPGLTLHHSAERLLTMARKNQRAHVVREVDGQDTCADNIPRTVFSGLCFRSLHHITDEPKVRIDTPSSGSKFRERPATLSIYLQILLSIVYQICVVFSDRHGAPIRYNIGLSDIKYIQNYFNITIQILTNKHKQRTKQYSDLFNQPRLNKKS